MQNIVTALARSGLSYTVVAAPEPPTGPATGPEVFLGGTCNNSEWRDDLIPKLEAAGIRYFNPVVPDWTPECQEREVRKRKSCDFVLYVITSEMTGVYSIAEAVESACERGPACCFCFIADGFDKFQIKSLEQVAAMVSRHGGMIATDLDDVVTKLVGATPEPTK